VSESVRFEVKRRGKKEEGRRKKGEGRREKEK
jgi:hypothetical protein